MSTENPLLALRNAGQSIWLDYIDRSLFGGRLKSMIEDWGVCGMTSNPAMFEKAIGGAGYGEAIAELARQGLDANAIYEHLAIEDVQHAADLFRPVFDASDGRDGLVSLEVSPHLAHDSAGTVAEARRLWGLLGRPNVMIKVPGTPEGVDALRTLIREGINVNVTLLFSVERYVEVAQAFREALEARQADGQPVAGVESVASFFVSRMDAKIDPQLDALREERPVQAEQARALRGQAAVANAAIAYRRFQELVADSRWQALAAAGARPQRLLWASTGVKDPSYSPVTYIERLVAPDTVNTVPLETLQTYVEHHAANPPGLTAAAPNPEATLGALAELGIDVAGVEQALEDEGVDKFVKPFDALLGSLEAVRTRSLSG